MLREFTSKTGQVRLLLGDCFSLMESIPLQSVDMVFTDPPYAMTDCAWDSEIDIGQLWQFLQRLSKEKAAMLFTASQPFTSHMVLSNLKQFKVEWIWKKNAGSNIGTVRWYPMKEHESILVFGNCKSGPVGTYNPIRQKRSAVIPTGARTCNYASKGGQYSGITASSKKCFTVEDGEFRVPSSVQFFNRERGIHPTQKPVSLCEYFIKTYSNPGDTVLDPFSGSGSTAIAALQCNRRAICIEIDEKYFNATVERVEEYENREAVEAESDSQLTLC